MLVPTLVTNNFDNLQKLVVTTRLMLDEKQELNILFDKLHPANAACIIQFLTPTEREEVINNLGQNFDPQILNFLDEGVRDTILDLWAVHEIANKLEQLDGQDAIKILEELNIEERRAMLCALKPEIRVFLEEGLSYPEESAGRLMHHHVVAVPQEWDVKKTIAFIKNAANLPKTINEIYIVNKHRKPIAKVELASLLKSDNWRLITEVAGDIEIVYSAIASQKDVFFAFRTYSLKSMPIIDKKERLIGVIHVTDIIDLIYFDAQNEFLHSGGLDESDFYDNLSSTSKARLKWLSFSIFGSIGVAILIDMFQNVFAKKTELVALMSIIMNISAVAGVQVVTVNIRAILNRELNMINIRRTLFKEMLVGLINGIILAILFGLIFGIKNLDIDLSLVLGISLVVNMLWAGMIGTLLPVIFHRFKIDPALSSGAFLACTIDAFSALSFFLIAKMVFNS